MSKHTRTRQERRERRQRRVRARIFGTAVRPRLNVHRSLRGMYAQLIDDDTGTVLASLHSKTAAVTGDAGGRAGKVAHAYLLGKALAEKAAGAGIRRAVFDRAGYAYHGRVQALAEGARDGGLNF